jgi:hypothetical protein
VLVGVAVVVVLASLGVVLGLSLQHNKIPIAAKGTHGYDVSWPQCSGTDAHNMPSGTPAYAVVGLTDVGDHTVNPCLGSQVSWAKDHGVRLGAYLLASYPTKAEQARSGSGLYGACGTSTLCRVRNDGAAQAREAIATMTDAGIKAPRIWIDVEARTINPWPRNPRRSDALLRGIVGGLRAGHATPGVYTTAHLWQQIAGSLRLNVPNWLPVGDEGPIAAQALCSTTATGGPTWLVQYTVTLDEDLTCPALDQVPGQPTAPDRVGRAVNLRDLRLSRFALPPA